MENKSSVMTKLNNKLRVLKECDLFKSAELNNTAARLTDKTQKEDYVLILNMKDSTKDSLAISIDCKGRINHDK